MPSTNISLETVIATSRKKGLVIERLLEDLLFNLKSGDVKGGCAEFVKANLNLIHERNDLKGAIDAILLSHEEKREAFEHLSRLSASIRHYWFADGYYTFRFTDERIEVYTYGDFRNKSVGGELNSDFLSFAWLDTDRYIVLCDDIENRSRREYMKVEINRLDFERMIGARPHKTPERRGPKAKIYSVEVEKMAFSLLQRQPAISKKEYEEKVFEWLGKEVGATQFAKYYGKHWTKNNRARKARGI